MTNPAKYIVKADQKSAVESVRDFYGDGSFYTMDCCFDYRLDEMLAAGAGTADELKAALARVLLAEGLPSPGMGAGCSAFIARNAEGHVLVGRNYDFRHEPNAMLVRTAPSEGLRTIGMADLCFLDFKPGQFSDGVTDLSAAVMMPYMTLDGISTRGIFIGVLQLKDLETHQDTGRTKITTTVAIRAVLDKAETVADAEEIFRSYDMQTARENNDYHFFVADRSGRSAVFEYCDGRLNVIDSPLVTNFLLTPGTRKRGGGKERYRVLKEILNYHGGALEKRDVMDALRLVSQPAAKGKSSTLWSAVYDLTDGTLELVPGKRYGEEPLRFEL